MTLTWENVCSEAARGTNPERPLTRSLDLGEEGLAMQATRTCSVDGCSNPHYGRGWCRSHYASYWRASRSALCSIEGCDGRQHARGWCITHYSRWRKTGDPGSADLLRQHGERCAVADCDRPYEGSGYCKLHRERWRKHGDPHHIAVPVLPDRRGHLGSAWRGDDVGYMGVHQRLYKDRGPAAGHQCRHCGTQAAEWAYDHADPDARVDPKRGPYSVNQSHYMPLCVPCHKRWDA